MHYIDAFNALKADGVDTDALLVATALLPSAQVPTSEAWDRAKAALKIHRAVGHPPMRRLVQVLREAQKPEWLVWVAESLVCPGREETKLGNQLVPNAALSESPGSRWRRGKLSA